MSDLSGVVESLQSQIDKLEYRLDEAVVLIDSVTECPEHGRVHGCEASQLRLGIEQILEDFNDAGLDPNGIVSLSDAEDMIEQLAKIVTALDELLKDVDAHDSLAFDEKSVRAKRPPKELAKVRVLFVPADDTAPVGVRYIEPTCDGLQTAVGGYFERVHLTTHTNSAGQHRQAVLYVDKNDIQKNLPLNERLTRRLRFYVPGRIYGDGFITIETSYLGSDEVDEADDDMVDLTDDEWAYWGRQVMNKDDKDDPADSDLVVAVKSGLTIEAALQLVARRKKARVIRNEIEVLLKGFNEDVSPIDLALQTTAIKFLKELLDMIEERDSLEGAGAGASADEVVGERDK